MLNFLGGEGGVEIQTELYFSMAAPCDIHFYLRVGVSV